RIVGEVGDPRLVSFPRFLPAVIEDYQPEYVFDGFWLPAGERMPAFMVGRYEVLKEWKGGNAQWPSFILFRRTTAPDVATSPIQ
ncbi:MAG: hypothetical protein ACREK1_13910, partial [Longimicrobiales bacterium]